MFAILLSFFIFFLGLIIGSFLNCVIYRLEVGESVAKGRSYCPHCKHNLIWLDLFPILSFIFLKGKCKYCRAPISVQYPLVEIATGLVFCLIYNLKFEILNQFEIFQILNLFFLFYIASAFIVIFVYDLKHYLIPDKILFPAIIITFFYRLFENLVFVVLNLNFKFQISNFSFLGDYLLATLLASGFFLAIYLVSKGKWMGFGDVKLAILLGLLLGFPNILVGLFLSFFFGAIIGVALILLSKKGLKSEVPFAPFLIIGTAVAMFFGSQLLQWYQYFLLF